VTSNVKPIVVVKTVELSHYIRMVQCSNLGSEIRYSD